MVIRTKQSLHGSINTPLKLVGRINVGSVVEQPNTYILRDEDGNEVVAVFTGSEVVFTATENDIRKGAVAATNQGVTVGTKVIPSYHTLEGAKLIQAGKRFVVTLQNYEYTKMQALICKYNSSLQKSVAVDKVSINSYVYPVGSTEVIASVTLDHATKAVDFGIINETAKPCVIRYFTYKEID